MAQIHRRQLPERCFSLSTSDNNIHLIAIPVLSSELLPTMHTKHNQLSTYQHTGMRCTVYRYLLLLVCNESVRGVEVLPVPVFDFLLSSISNNDIVNRSLWKVPVKLGDVTV